MAETSLKAIIIGMMAFALFISVAIFITVDTYDVERINVNLSSDNNTKNLADLQTKINEQKDELMEDNSYISDRTVGGDETELGIDASESNLISSSLTALSNTPSYINTFFKMITSLGQTIGGSIGGALSKTMWFFVGSLVLIVSMLLLGSVLQRSP